VDLENAIMAHPKVMEAAVIAIPDARWAERPLAAVKPAPGVEELTEAEIIEFIRDDFAKFWLPDKVIVVADIPKTSTGKFDKKVLRAQYAAGELQ
ncbi:MAG: AMP-dependent synthetase, partial [Anaerolineales bacterium]|nr:AMP-dependent synthetase [Anaerolineales bacterium]